ncbi:hypothetical protein JW968_06420 [Candidatus Woesearchaeota archaeon]|nr:hypothetical protein [Candidatus Woesearchaeota archaeon]
MDVSEAMLKIRDSEKYKDFCRERPDAYLAHCFRMLDEANQDTWQIGFFDKGSDKLTTFFVSEDSVEKNQEADALKKDEEIIKELDMKKVLISFNKAIELGDRLKHDKYPNEEIMKKIIILQHLPSGQVYNMTYVTQSFRILNIKLDSGTGKVREHNLASIMDLGKMVK